MNSQDSIRDSILNKQAERKINIIKGFLTLHQIEMFLCEQQKYVKMVNKTGKQRSKYVQKTF